MANTRLCRKCGEMVPADIAVCNHCGNRCVIIPIVAASPKAATNQDATRPMHGIDSDTHVGPGDC